MRSAWGETMVIRSPSQPPVRFHKLSQGQRWLPLVVFVMLPLATSSLADVTGQQSEQSLPVVASDNGTLPLKHESDALAVMLAQAEPAAPVKRAPPAETAQGNKGVVQLLNQVEALNGELSRLRGQIEVLTNDVSNAQKRQRDMYVDLDTRLRRIEQLNASRKEHETIAALEERIRRLEQGSATTANIPQPVGSPIVAPPVTPPPAAATAAASSTAPGSPSTSATPATAVVPGAAGTAAAVTSSLPPASLSATDQSAIQRVYDNAYSSYRLNDYLAAIRGFDGFLKTYPKHALASNAQYWIGECYFQLRDYRAAIEAERRLLGTYPESAKVPDGMLIIGTAESNLGDTPAARKTLEELVARFSGTDAAEKAKSRLAKLK